MKKLLALILAVVCCLGMVACGGKTDNKPEVKGNNLDQAVSYLNNLYKDAAKNTPADYELVGKLIIGEDVFTVTWTVDNEAIKVVASEKADFWTIDVPDENPAEAAYTITATVKAADGETKTKSFDKVLPVIEVSNVVSEPVEGDAYKLYVDQVSAGKTVYAIGEISGGRYIKSVADAKEAPDFFAEKVEGGYKFYTSVDGAKKYVVIAKNDEGKICLIYDETGAVWYFKEDVLAWMTMFEGAEYYMGTYSTYETLSASASSYIKPDNTGVSQFPANLVPKDVAEAMTPEVPALPTEITTATEIGAMTVPSEGPILTQGIVTEIKNETYGNLYIKDASGNTVYIYGLYDAEGAVRFDAMETKPQVGDFITVVAPVTFYNDAPQLQNAKLQTIVPVTALKDAAAMTEASAGDVMITATVKEIKNETYGNIYLEDAEGNTLYVYGLYDETGEIRFDAMETKPQVGDVITVVGPVTIYNEAPQLKNAKVVVLPTAAE